MGPYYKSITSASNILPLDKTLLAEMEAANEEELKKLDERVAEAEKIEG
jgi:26S proteasome regulatory subunit N7